MSQPTEKDCQLQRPDCAYSAVPNQVLIAGNDTLQENKQNCAHENKVAEIKDSNARAGENIGSTHSSEDCTFKRPYPCFNRSEVLKSDCSEKNGASDCFEDIDEDLIDDDEDTERYYRNAKLIGKESSASSHLEAESFKQSDDKDVKQLLNFAENVNTDIQKYFGKKQGGCDIYEDKWVSGKSGRELYYADLLKIAQGYEDGETGDSKPSSKSGKSHKDKNNKTNKRPNENTVEQTGKMDPQIGLGPLEELFEKEKNCGIVNNNSKEEVAHEDTQDNALVKSNGKVAPLNPLLKRKLPPSFWKEPSSLQPQPQKQCVSVSSSTNNGDCSNAYINTQQNSPDFSDLLDIWVPENYNAAHNV